MFPTAYFDATFWPPRYWPRFGGLVWPTINPATGAGIAAVPIRRLRQAPHVAHENTRLVYGRFQLDVHAGIAQPTGQGQNPTIYLSWSDNAGKTWSNERPVQLGPERNYRKRAIWRRLGQSRSRIFRVVVSDPVDWILLQAFLDIVGGGQS